MAKWALSIALSVLLVALAPPMSTKGLCEGETQFRAGRESSVPSGWNLYPAPALDSQDMKCAQRSRWEWRVRLEGGQVRIEQSTQLYDDGRRHLPFDLAGHFDSGHDFLAGHCQVESVPDGWLVAFDAGEWGGALYWFNQSGENKYKLIDGAIVGLDTLSGTIVAVRSFHRNGEAYKITKSDSRWEAKKFARFPSDPRLTEPENEKSLLILTSDDLLRLRSSGEADTLVPTQFDYLYPDSMVLEPLGALYIGMRHFVGRLTDTGDGWLEQWLVPEDCTRFRLDEETGECVCAGQEEGQW